MTYSVLDADGIKRYFTALGAGTADDPYVSMPIPYERGLVDLGSVFLHSDRHTVANNGTFTYLIITPSSPAHVELLEIGLVTGSSPIYIDFFENTVVTANGTAEGLLNLNRQSATGASTLLYMSPTFNAGAEGTKIFEYMIHGEKNIGGTNSEYDRIILKPAYKYLIKIQNVSGANTTVAIKIVIGED